MTTKSSVVWAASTWGDDFQPPIYFNTIPLVLPVGAVLEIKRRRNKREQTTTETVTVRMPRRKVANASQD